MKFIMDIRTWNGLMKAAKSTISKGLDAKRTLSGVYIETNKAGESATFTSCDGYCMAQWIVPIMYESGDDCKALVNPLTASGKKGDIVRVSIGDDVFSVTNLRTLITVRQPIIQHDYVDHEQIIPKDRDDQYTHVNPNILTRAMAGYELLEDESHAMKISMSKEKTDPIILSADNGSIQFRGLVLPVRIY
jgi:hypothetical protein